MDRMERIKKVLKIQDNDILFLTGHYYLSIKNNCLSFGIFKKLKTKKNNYVPKMNIGLYNKIIESFNNIYYKGKTIDFGYEKNIVIANLKGLYGLRKSDEVKNDEAFLMRIFQDIKNFNFNVKRKIKFYNENGQKEKQILVFFSDKIVIPSQYYFFLKVNQLDNISFTDYILKEKSFKDKETGNKIDVKDTIINDKYYFQNKIKNIMLNFFNEKYIKEDYYYIIDQKSKNEKDLTNTVELFNDVLQKGVKIIDKEIDFDDKAIINITGNKLFYNKNIKNILKEFYVFNFYSIEDN